MRLWKNNVPDDGSVLQELASPGFDPSQTVLLSSNLPAPPAGGTNAGTVVYESYEPKHLRLRVQTASNAVLLLNDKYHPGWTAQVDGKPADILRCNYIMRGLYLPPGDHSVEFRFAASTNALWASLAAEVAALALLGFARLTATRQPGTPTQ